jgi:hypothetical protein
MIKGANLDELLEPTAIVDFDLCGNGDRDATTDAFRRLTIMKIRPGCLVSEHA